MEPGVGASATVTVLCAELDGAALRTQLGEAAGARLDWAHECLLAGVASRQHATVLDSPGARLLAVFDTSDDAVSAAVGMQQAVASYNRRAATPLAVRIGLCAGPVSADAEATTSTPIAGAMAGAVATCAQAAPGHILHARLADAALAGGGGALGDGALGDGALGDGALGDGALGDGALGDSDASDGDESAEVAAPDDPPDDPPADPPADRSVARPAAAPAHQVADQPAWPAVEEVAWTPRREPGGAHRAPLPAVLGEADAFPFVGRELERQTLNEAWKSTVAGERQIVLIAGDPGVGKSRLIAEFAAAAYDGGGIVLAGRCDEDVIVSYQPFVQALRHLVGHTADNELTGLLGASAERLVPLLPALAERLTGPAAAHRLDPPAEQWLLFDAVGQWLTATSAYAPVLLVLEDLHAASAPTLRLLRHLSSYAGPLRVLVVGGYRDVGFDLAHPLTETLAELREDTGTRHITLDGWDAAGVAAFVTAAMGHDLDHRARQVAADLQAKTGGNPLYVGEVLRHLAETGAISLRNRRWTVNTMLADSGIRGSLREVVGQRLSLLPAAAADTLVRASVLGLVFDTAVLQATSDIGADALAAALAEAEAARMIAPLPEQRYRLSHPLVRSALYELASLRRARLHRRAGQAIESCFGDQLDDHLPELAHHFAQAGASDSDRVVRYARQAADQALSLHAYADALRYYEQALRWVGADDVRRCDLLTGLGLAQRGAGDPMNRQTLLSASALALAAGDSERAGRAVAGTAHTLWSLASGPDAELAAAYAAALDALGEADSPLRARLLAARASELAGESDRVHRVRLADDAVAIARRLDDRTLLADVLAQHWYASYDLSSVHERRRTAAELRRLAGTDPAPRLASYRCLLVSALELADGDEVDRQLAAAGRLAAALGAPMPRWQALLGEVAGALLRGRLTDAEGLIARALAVGREAGHPDAPRWHTAQLFHLRFEQGRLTELVDLLAEQVRQAPGVPVHQARLALARCAAGRPDDGRQLLDTLSAARFAVPQSAGWGQTMGVLTQLCGQLADLRHGDTRHADGLYRVLAPYAGTVITDGVAAFGATDYHLGVLATLRRRYDVAEERFAAAAALYDRLRAPAWQARLDLAHAQLLQARGRRGDAARAEQLADRARATATQLGRGGLVGH